MFKGFSPRTLEFMFNIRFNNNKAWFDEHKQEYLQDFYNPMKALGQAVLQRMQVDFPDRGLFVKTARIYRDARRVRDGKPYRDNLWFTIESAAPYSAFWFDLTPENWIYGMGFWPNAALMAKLRARMEQNPKKVERLIAPLEKQSEFTLEGEEYARKKSSPSQKLAPWYNKKCIVLAHRQKNSEELYSPDLADRLAEGFKFLMPFYEYISEVGSDPTP